MILSFHPEPSVDPLPSGTIGEVSCGPVDAIDTLVVSVPGSTVVEISLPLTSGVVVAASVPCCTVVELSPDRSVVVSISDTSVVAEDVSKAPVDVP